MRRLSAFTALVAILATGCGGGTLEIEDIWARATASTQDSGAVYMTIHGGPDDDSLIGVSVNSTIAARAEMHETSMMEGEDGAEMMMMSPLSSITVPAGDEVRFEPGGYHVMLFQLATPLVTGSDFILTLVFENAADQEVTVEVRES